MHAQSSFHFSLGAGLAISCAGPVFLTLLWLGELVIVGHSAWIGSIGSFFTLLPLAVIVGAVLGAVPIVLGGLIMGHLGTDIPDSRRYIVWAIAGMIVAQLIQLVLGLPFTMALCALFQGTGTICALIVRYGTRWSDDSA